jgi:hypothetical protein
MLQFLQSTPSSKTSAHKTHPSPHPDTNPPTPPHPTPHTHALAHTRTRTPSHLCTATPTCRIQCAQDMKRDSPSAKT